MSESSPAEKLHVNLSHDDVWIRRQYPWRYSQGANIVVGTMSLCSVILPLLSWRCTENSWDSHAIMENCATPPTLYTHKAADSCIWEFCRVVSSSQMCPLCGHRFTRVYSKGSFSVNEAWAVTSAQTFCALSCPSHIWCLAGCASTPRPFLESIC